jgi:hypothetical protein
VKFISAFLRGMAPVLDIGGTLHVPEYIEDDGAVIASDWAAVGGDMWAAMAAASEDLPPEVARAIDDHFFELWEPIE